MAKVAELIEAADGTWGVWVGLTRLAPPMLIGEAVAYCEKHSMAYITRPMPVMPLGLCGAKDCGRPAIAAVPHPRLAPSLTAVCADHSPRTK